MPAIETRTADQASTLDGTVERVTFFNPENGFSVLKVRVRGRRGPVAVVGTLPAAQPGERLVMTGRWRVDPVHGTQFGPDAAEVRPPAAADDVVLYLGSGLVREIGPVLARRIVAHFGERTLDVLDAQPERVREVPGIGPRRAASLSSAWAEHRALRDVSAFLASHKVDTRLAPRLVQALGTEAPRVLATNPYRLVAEVPGFGFASADRLGKSVAIRPTAPARLQAAVQAVLVRASEQGHTRTGLASLLEAAAGLTGVDEPLLEGAVAQLVAGDVVGSRGRRLQAVADVPALGPGGEATDGVSRPASRDAGPGSATGPGSRLRVYEPSSSYEAEADLGIGLMGLVRAEESLARWLIEMAERPTRQAPAAVDAWLSTDQDAAGLSDEQRAAVRAAATRSLFVLTGGPGVGKTTTVRALVRCLTAMGRSVALAAPTGKAAKRLGDVVGLEAKTLHRLLGAAPKGFRHGPSDPLPFDVVVVDEVSMLDTQLARALVGAVDRRAQLVLVGDADQLPSVGPGQVLRDLLSGDRVPSTRLETVFRQAAASQIVTSAHAIRRGEVPEIAHHARLGDVDCVFVPAPGARVSEVAAEWAVRRLPGATGLDRNDVQVLAPLKRVCQALNAALQPQLNPPTGQAERPHGALPLRVGDRVIQTRNNYLLAVFNGDAGRVVAVEPQLVVVDFGDDRTVEYAPGDLLDLDHAYCLTVHRAQGSEWPGVVLIVSSSHGPLLSRNLLYTGLTRARRFAVVVGDQAAIASAVANTRDQTRQTGLATLLARQ
jgi:exodeoxyribonuclease V alpha subunit